MWRTRAKGLWSAFLLAEPRVLSGRKGDPRDLDMPNAPINYRAMLQDALEASDLGQVKGIITPEGRQRSRATEHPDLWSLLEIKEGQQVGYKVLASYCGGYLGGDAWRFSTRVVRVEDAGHALAPRDVRVRLPLPQGKLWDTQFGGERLSGSP